MKNFTKTVWLLIIVSISMSAQQEVGIIGTNNWLNGWTEFVPNKVNYGENTHILTGNISEDLTLHKKNTYLLVGNVFVTNNAILSIEPGTVILGDAQTKATLTITVGAALIAEGTVTDPIVFTSNKSNKKAGDWGGIILLGDGQTNKLGGNSATPFYAELEPSDYVNTNFGGESQKINSGFLSYVRIEFAGGKSKRHQVPNALLLAGVGKETTINNVMISHSGGHALNVIGGEINMDHIVSYKSSGNDFNFSYGAVININNSLAVRSPYTSASDSKSLNVISYEKASEVDFTKQATTVVAQNIALVTDSETLENDIKVGLVKEAIYVGEHTNFNLEKSVISGFSKAVILDQNIVINDANLSKIKLKNTYFNNCTGNVYVNLNENNEDLENWYGNPSFMNVYSKTHHAELFIELNNSKKPDYRLKISKIIAMTKD